VVLALTCLLIEDPAQKFVRAKTKLIDAASELLRIPMFRLAVVGYCAHTAAVGAFAFWAPSYLVKEFGMRLDKASFWFGMITVVGGAIGTIVGGWWADRSQRAFTQVTNETPHDAEHNLSGMAQLLKICAIGVAVGGALWAKSGPGCSSRKTMPIQRLDSPNCSSTASTSTKTTNPPVYQPYTLSRLRRNDSRVLRDSGGPGWLSLRPVMRQSSGSCTPWRMSSFAM